MEKKCTKCGEIKNIELFALSIKGKFGRRSDCKICHCKYYHTIKIKNNIPEKRKLYRKDNLEKCRIQARESYYRCKDKSKDTRLKRTYGIDLEQHNQILKDQDHKCSICGTDTPGSKGQFNVDHCHKTGKVRGLLCWSCNTFIGYSKENINSLKKAIEYLTKHSV